METTKKLLLATLVAYMIMIILMGMIWRHDMVNVSKHYRAYRHKNTDIGKMPIDVLLVFYAYDGAEHNTARLQMIPTGVGSCDYNVETGTKKHNIVRRKK